MTKSVDSIFLKFEKEYQKQIEKKVERAVEKLYGEIIDRTPVDTGYLRKQWEINVGNGYINPGVDFSAKGQISIPLDTDKEITIRNQANYAYYVEYGKISRVGYSQQAPSGMLRISAKNFRNYLK